MSVVWRCQLLFIANLNVVDVNGLYEESGSNGEVLRGAINPTRTRARGV